MIIDVFVTPERGYDSPGAAVLGGQAISAEWAPFHSHELRGSVVEGVTFDLTRLALHLSGGQSLVAKVGPTHLEVSLEPTEQTKARSQSSLSRAPLEHSTLRFHGGVNPEPGECPWSPHDHAQRMIGRKIYALSFAQHHMYVAVYGNDQALHVAQLRMKDTNEYMLYWWL